MAVIGATQLEPVNVLGQYVQGLEAGRQFKAQRAKEAQVTQLQNMLMGATPKQLQDPEFINRLAVTPEGAMIAKTLSESVAAQRTARKDELEIAAQQGALIAREAGAFLGDPNLLNKATIDPWAQGAVQRGILSPEAYTRFQELSDDPAVLGPAMQRLQMQGVSLADQLRYSRLTPGEQLTANVTTRGQDLTATTAARGQDITVRGQDVVAGTARRGQDITARGQDITATTAARGQDITMRGQDITATIQSPEYQARVTSARERAISDVKFSTEFNSAETTAQRTLTLLDDLIGDAKVVNGKVVVEPKGRKPMEGFAAAVGAAAIPGQRFIPGTAARDFNAVHDQAVGAAFMQAFATLKGGGQITEKEGEKATAALTRMNLAQSEPEYIRAAREFKSEVKTVMEIAKTRYNAVNPSAQSRNAKPGTKTTSSGTPYEELGD